MSLFEMSFLTVGEQLLIHLLEKKRINFLKMACLEIDRLRKFIQLLNDIIVDRKYNHLKISIVFIKKVRQFQFTQMDDKDSMINEFIFFNKIKCKETIEYPESISSKELLETSSTLTPGGSTPTKKYKYRDQSSLCLDLNKANEELFERVSYEILRLHSIVQQLSMSVLRLYEEDVISNEISDMYANNKYDQWQFQACYKALYELDLFPVAINKIIAEYYVGIMYDFDEMYAGSY